MNRILFLALPLVFISSVFAKNADASNTPIFNIFELGVRQGQTITYNEIASKNITTSIKSEHDTLGMFSLKQKENPNIAYMIEIYSDSSSYKKHITSPGYHNFLNNAPLIIEENHKRKIDVTPKFLGDKKFTQDNMTINNLVIVDVKPEFNQSFQNVVVPEMKQSLKVENGVLAMYAVTEKDNPTRWYFYEIYASEDAYQAHRKTLHFKNYLNQTANMANDKEAIAVVPHLLMNKGGLAFNGD